MGLFFKAFEICYILRMVDFEIHNLLDPKMKRFLETGDCCQVHFETPYCAEYELTDL